VRSALESRENTITLSVGSIWQIQIKEQIGKLTLKRPFRSMVNDQINRNGLQVLSIMHYHVYALESLPIHHKDPFDRIIIAQAYVEGFTLTSHDAMMNQYPVVVLW
jgi:PIN domain nuclease of toxin-antitoxin system